MSYGFIQLPIDDYVNHYDEATLEQMDLEAQHDDAVKTLVTMTNRHFDPNTSGRIGSPELVLRAMERVKWFDKLIAKRNILRSMREEIEAVEETEPEKDDPEEDKPENLK
jgi:hypothetical protein